MNTRLLRNCNTVGGRCVLRADFSDKNEGQIILFRLSENRCCPDSTEGEYYIAVPNGQSVTLCNVPFSDFTLEVI